MNSEKKTVLIIMHYMELGGAEMSLLGLLHALDPTKVKVDLFIHSHQGALIKYIPDWINILPEIPSYSMLEKPIKYVISKGFINIGFRRILGKWQAQIYKLFHVLREEDDDVASQYVANCVTPCLQSIQPNVCYDLCISYLTPHNIGLRKVEARNKLAWIHTDYSKLNINRYKELKVWEKYDYVASISPDVTKSFLLKFPSLKSKVLEIENIIPSDYILKRAEESFEHSNDKSLFINRHQDSIRLVSIGRFSYPKNFDNIPDICKTLLTYLSKNSRDSLEEATGSKLDAQFFKTVDLKWIIIGYGSDESLIKQKIEEAGMQEHVVLLGKRENPYPYIKSCDIYVQPSRYEGKSITVREAQILHKPVVITDYPTAHSQIQDGIDGVIVPMDNNGCANGLGLFLRNKELQENIHSYLEQHDYSGQHEIDKIYSLLT